MTERSRRIFRDFLVYGVGDFLSRAVSLITLPVYTRLILPKDYGIWILISTITAVFGFVLELGGTTAYARFFFEAKTLEQRKKLTSSWILFLFLWGFLITGVLSIFAKSISGWAFGVQSFKTLFIISFLTMPISMINNLCGQALRNRFNAVAFSVLNLLSVMLMIGFAVYGITLLHLGIAALIQANFIAAFIMLPLRLWFIRDLLAWSFSIPALKSMLKFGLPLVPMSAAYWIFMSSDRIVLGKLASKEQVGFYAVANTLANVLIFLSTSFGRSWAPHALEAYESRVPRVEEFFGKVLTQICAVFGTLCVAITAFSGILLKFFTAPAFYEASRSVGPLALGGVALACTHVTALGISLKKRTSYFAFFAWLAALLNLGLNLWWVPRFGMMGSAWATAISYAFLTISYAIKSQKLMPITYEQTKLFFAILLTLVFTLAAMMLHQRLSFQALLLKTAAVGLYGLLLFTLKIIDLHLFKNLLSFFRKKSGT